MEKKILYSIIAIVGLVAVAWILSGELFPSIALGVGGFITAGSVGVAESKRRAERATEELRDVNNGLRAESDKISREVSELGDLSEQGRILRARSQDQSERLDEILRKAGYPEQDPEG